MATRVGFRRSEGSDRSCYKNHEVTLPGGLLALSYQLTTVLLEAALTLTTAVLAPVVALATVLLLPFVDRAVRYQMLATWSSYLALVGLVLL